MIPEAVIASRHRHFQEYVDAGVGFRRFYFAIGATADVNNSNEQINASNPVESRPDIVADGMRKLFKLGKALSVPRGAPGRLATVFGSLASAADQWNAAVLAEEVALRTAAEKSARMEAKSIADEHEKPIVCVLKTGGYLTPGSRLTRKAMAVMFAKNPSLLRNLNLIVSASRRAMVDALLSKLSD